MKSALQRTLLSVNLLLLQRIFFRFKLNSRTEASALFSELNIAFLYYLSAALLSGSCRDALYNVKISLLLQSLLSIQTILTYFLQYLLHLLTVDRVGISFLNYLACFISSWIMNFLLSTWTSWYQIQSIKGLLAFLDQHFILYLGVLRSTIRTTQLIIYIVQQYVLCLQRWCMRWGVDRPLMTLSISNWISVIFNKSMLHGQGTLTVSILYWKTSGACKAIHNLFISCPSMHRSKGSSSNHACILVSQLQSVWAVRVEIIIRESLIIVLRVILNHESSTSIWTAVIHIIGANVLSRLILKVELSSCLSLSTAVAYLLHLLYWLVVVLLRRPSACYLVVQVSAILVFYETSSLGHWTALTSWLKPLHWVSICEEWTSYHRLRTI